MPLPPRLYHYQPFKPERLSPIIEGNTIYFSNPKDFNDPWDCRPCFDASILEDPVARERHIAFYMNADRKHFPKPEAEHARREHALRNTPGFLEALIDKMTGIDGSIFKRYRVYCLSAKPDCTLMWSHYAANHTGVCLEYDSTAQTTIATALQIDYRDQYPAMDLTDQGPAVLLPLITKSSVWAYEAEYRLIAQERAEAASRGVTLLTDNNLLTLPDGTLRAVIAGCSMPPESRERLRAMIDGAGNKIMLREAKRIPNRYDLMIE